MKTKLLLFAGLTTGLALQLCSPTLANPITITGSASPGAVIPDDDSNGLASTITLTAPFKNITSVEVSIVLTGAPAAWNGDYYAYVQFSSGLVVLLNNLDGTVSNPYGSPGDGFDVTFSDTAANISTAPVVPGQPLTGTYAPQAGSLSAFDGMNPNGAWTLFLADEQPGGVGALQSWSLEVTGTEVTTIPDNGGTMGLLAFGASSLSLWSLPNRRLSKGHSQKGQP